MLCPACGNLVPPDPILSTLTICPSCLSSLVIEGESCRRAVSTDTAVLDEAQLATLRKARKRYREASA